MSMNHIMASTPTGSGPLVLKSSSSSLSSVLPPGYSPSSSTDLISFTSTTLAVDHYHNHQQRRRQLMMIMKYDVFLSFRGEDTRMSFVDHLYKALRQEGIVVFKDDQQLEKGKAISDEVVRAIQDSRILMVVFSRNFATSTWCLDELVKISECVASPAAAQTVVPLFYDVDPSEVRKQSGCFLKAFSVHEQVFGNNIAKVNRWRNALTQVSNIAGWDLQNKYETEAIHGIVKEISRKLWKSSPNYWSAAKDLVGIKPRLAEIASCLGIGSQVDDEDGDVRVVGICGMGGIGKTTIVRLVYDRLSCEFEGHSFLENVRESHEKHGLPLLQEQLLSQVLNEEGNRVRDVHGGMQKIRSRLCSRRVLIVLDDVHHLDQLKSLAGDPSWFGRGSRIIITTRDEHVLMQHGVDRIYRVEGLDYEESMQLFCLKAFRNDTPESGYMELSNHFVKYANGLPLALDVLGSFLFGRSISEWESALDRLIEIPNKDILDKLQVSFDGLEEMEKKIFLDIACFLKGQSKDYVERVLGSCGFYPEIGLRVLVDKSLITILNDKVWMHDLLEEMGREIVRRESKEEPGKRSRLWLYQDLCDVLSKDTGTEQVEAIVVGDSGTQEAQEQLSAKAFSKMKRLRLLKLQNLQFSGGLDHLSNELRHLEWDGYPFKSFPSTFQPHKLVELHIRGINIQQLWEGSKLQQPLKMLKVMDLSYSQNLVKTSDFRQFPNLQELNLEGCTRLSEIHQSIGSLKSLVSLNLKNCESLVELPSSICDSKSLKFLNLHGCSRLDKLPEKLGCITSLEKLSVGRINSTQVRSTSPWSFLPRLWFLKWKNDFQNQMPSLSSLRSLRSLDLSGLSLAEGSIPNDLGCFPLLQTLNLSGNNFETLPTSIIRLSKLEEFRLTECKKLQSLPVLPSSILYLSADGCTSLGAMQPTSNISQFSELDILSIVNCTRLRSVPDLSSSVVRLSADGTSLQATPFERQASNTVQLTFVNSLRLIEIEGNNSISVFARMASYLHFLLKHSRQAFALSLANTNTFYSPISHISMYLRGSEIPRWFNNQGVGSVFDIHLSPHWFNNKWMGFAFSAVFEVHHPRLLPPSGSFSLSCDLFACVSTGEDLYLGSFAVQMSPDELDTSTDGCWFYFIPPTSLNCLNQLVTCSNFRASFVSEELNVKCSGFRIVYGREVDELIICDKALEDSGCCQNQSQSQSQSQRRTKAADHRSSNKRSWDEYNTCSPSSTSAGGSGGVESGDQSGNSGTMMGPKRMRNMPLDRKGKSFED